MSRAEEEAAVAADGLSEPGIAELYQAAVKRRNLRLAIRVVVVLLTL